MFRHVDDGVSVAGVEGILWFKHCIEYEWYSMFDPVCVVVDVDTRLKKIIDEVVGAYVARGESHFEFVCLCKWDSFVFCDWIEVEVEVRV